MTSQQKIIRLRRASDILALVIADTDGEIGELEDAREMVLRVVEVLKASS